MKVRFRYEFLNKRSRVKVEKILNGYLFVLIISTNKMVVVFFNQNEAIFRSFGNEHYLDYFRKLE
jgi:hypothetical protein